MFDHSPDKEPFQTPKATPRLAPSAETLPIRVMTDASSRIQKSAISIASICGGGSGGGILCQRSALDRECEETPWTRLRMTG
jgi:hypothetical protein